MKRIPLSKGRFATVDDDDYEDLMKYRWYAMLVNRVWYATRGTLTSNGGNFLLMHNEITGVRGIDHIDGNGLNNQRSNLRQSTHKQNRGNSQRNINNTSGFKGVSWHKRDKVWRAYIRSNDIHIHLGNFDSSVRAACAYDDAAREIHGEFARLNFPTQEE